MKTISLRELHERTGHWVRHAAANDGVTVTDRGEPVATLKAHEKPKGNKFANRKLVPEYKRLMGKLKPTSLEHDSTRYISEDRDRPI